MSTFNLAQLQQKQDQLIYTIDELVEMLRKLPSTGYQQVQYYDRNGNLVTKNIPNIGELINQFSRGVNAQMAKTVYVDQVNGSDTSGDGSQNAPFKTLPKAIDSVPVGGFGRIHILGTYDTRNTLEHVKVVNKVLEIVPEGEILVGWTPVTIGTNTYDSLTLVLICESSSINFLIDSNKGGKITIEDRATTNPFYLSRMGLVAVFSMGVCSISFTFRTRVDNYTPLYLGKDASLCNVEAGSRDKRFVSFHFSGHYAGVGREAVISDPASESSLLRLPYNACASYYVNYEGGLKDGLGNAVDPATLVKGVVKDVNGVPRNVISNLVL